MEYELRGLVYPEISAFGVAENIKVRMPNKPLLRDKLKRYMSISTLPVQPQLFTVCDGGSIYVWLVQVSIYYRDGVGEEDITQVADKIRAAFPVNREFVGQDQTYRVDLPAALAPSVPTEGWYFIPVTIRIKAIN